MKETLTYKEIKEILAEIKSEVYEGFDADLPMDEFLEIVHKGAVLRDVECKIRERVMENMEKEKVE